MFQFLNVKHILFQQLQVCVCIHIAEHSLNFDRSIATLNATLKTY